MDTKEDGKLLEMPIGNKKFICNSDGYVNLTQIVETEGKCFNQWFKSTKTKEFLKEVEKSKNIPLNKLIIYKLDKNNYKTAWGDMIIAVNVAQWASIEFGIQVSKWIFELLSTGKTKYETKISIKNNTT